MKFNKLLAVYFLLAFCGTALTRSSMDQCIDRVNGIDCITTESEVEDQRMNNLYQGLMRRLSKNRQTQLRQTQRDWLRFRDSNSVFYYDPDGGQNAYVQSVLKYHEMTKNRADELQEIW
ncbi:MAG: DUF1311 domain-containing protein [Candidatus Competibacteraceae bacterium]|nr:DUF1311 domain-containing protein [Candidatus Competibacteraceae bacterium]